MTHRVGIRELRNRTKDVLDQAARDGEVIITNNGEDVAVVRPLIATWDRFIDGIIQAAPPPHETGWLDELADDDETSMGDLA